MLSTRSSSNKARKILDASSDPSTCVDKNFPNQTWCNNCRDSVNLGSRQIRKPCEEPWKYKINSNNARERLFAIKTHKHHNEIEKEPIKKRMRTISPTSETIEISS